MSQSRTLTTTPPVFFLPFYKDSFVIKQSSKVDMPLNKDDKKNEQDMLGTTAKVKTNSSAMFSYGLLRMDTPVLV